MRTSTAFAAFLSAALCCHGQETNQANEALDQARQFAAEGKFEEALERHIWFHNHALETSPGQYGVRLSFALADWVKLGEKYPKALQALKEIRDTKTARLLGGEGDRFLFHDVVSINRELGESKSTVETFKKIAASQERFAASVADIADEALFEGHEYPLERKYLGDPNARFDRLKSSFDWGMEYAKKSGIPDRSRHAFEHNFTDEVVRLIVVLDKTGDHNAARLIQARALAAHNSEAIKNAVGN